MIDDAASVTRTVPLSAMRTIAFAGCAIWGLAAVFFLALIVSASGADWRAPNVYASLAVLAFGLALNALLLTRGGGSNPTLGNIATIVSLALSSAMLGLWAYIAFDLGS